MLTTDSDIEEMRKMAHAWVDAAYDAETVRADFAPGQMTLRWTDEEDPPWSLFNEEVSQCP